MTHEEARQPSPAELYADDMRELPSGRVLAAHALLGDALRNADQNTPLESLKDLRDRFVGTGIVLGELDAGEDASATPDDQPDPPSYMIRIDGSVDVVSGRGVQAYERTDFVPETEIVKSFIPDKVAAPTAQQPAKHGGVDSTHRRVIL